MNFLYVIVGLVGLLSILWWKDRWRLLRHKGLSLDDFIKYFQAVGISNDISKVTYLHFRQMIGMPSFQPHPNDSFDKTFKIADEDIDDEVEEILKELKLEMPHSGILKEWDDSPETLSDLIHWLAWVKDKKIQSKS